MTDQSSDLVARARRFAELRHRGQFRKGAAREPFVTHLEEVAGLVARFGGDTVAQTAAWLHDTVEDCPPTSLADIETEFGAGVAAIVTELTDDKRLDKAERKRLQVTNAPGKSAAGALLKLCDKISNVGTLGTSPPDGWPIARQEAYVAWARSVVSGLPDLPPQALAEFDAVCAATRAAIARRSAG